MVNDPRLIEHVTQIGSLFQVDELAALEAPMPITADELRLAGHHLDQAIESLRLAAHCVQTDPNTLLALHLEMLKQQAHEMRAILAEQRRTSAS